jgi:hypothetical protein
MNTTKLLFLFGTTIISTFLIIIGITYYIKGRVNRKLWINITISEALWAGSLLIGGGILINNMIPIFTRSLEIVEVSKKSTLLAQGLKYGAIYTGIALTLVFFIEQLSQMGMLLLFRARDLKKEIENQNVPYFIIKSVLIIVLSLLICYTQQQLLEQLMPAVPSLFIH